MTVIRQLVPEPREVAAEDVVARVRDAPSPLPFAPESVEFCVRLSQGIQRHPVARRSPELVALAFWLRRAELEHLQEAFRALETDEALPVPHGVALHFPPGNVDTIFVYSWVLALLVGNRNIVRLSTRESQVASVLCEIINDVLGRGFASPLRAANAIVSYAHDRDVTAVLSGGCDVRVVWGGDASVAQIRAVPMPPHARDVTFPDRYSLAVLNADAVQRADAETRRRLARGLFNDIYWFDQLGCSSPRLVVWVGGRDAADAASALVLESLQDRIDAQGHRLDTGAVLQKVTFAHGAVAVGQADGMRHVSNELTVLDVVDLAHLSKAHPGAGLLFQAVVSDLDAVVPIVDRKVQTVGYFGFDTEELRGWVRRLNGRGVDRVVPIGQALQFHRYWDGYDLLRAMTRVVHVAGDRGGVPTPEEAD